MNQLRTLFLKEFTKYLIANSKPREIILPNHPIKPLIEERYEKGLEVIPYPEHVVLSSPGKIQPAPAGALPFMRSTNPFIASINPAPLPLPDGFNLGKLNSFIFDRNVLNIDCSGPGKILTVKSGGRIVPTSIMLAEDEIRNVINTFSQFARIPVLSGMFKAAVGNLIITGVISDLVGSRFIIRKNTPYSILESRM